MCARIVVPEALKEQIKARNSILDIISEYTTLNREGNLYAGRCPFPHGGTKDHPVFDDNPSFKVYPNNTFYCFGCHRGRKDDGGAGSDVIALIMELHDLGYIEACRYLAEKAGLEFNLGQSENSSYNTLIQKVTEENRTYFRGLWNEEHVDIVAQISQERGLDPVWLKENARMGLVPADHPWSLIAGRLALGIPEMAKTAKPRTVAMAYRTLTGDGAKWVNDPASAAFDKKSMLYMFPYAYKAIRKKGYAIVVEGYFDTLACHYRGLTNTVGLMGSQFTDEQMNILRRETDTLLLWPDGDISGRAIVESNLPKLLEKGFRVLEFVVKEDPDEWLKLTRTSDIEAYITTTAVHPLKNIIQSARKVDLDKVITLLKYLKSPGELAIYLDMTSRRYGLDVHALIYAMKEVKP